MARTRVIAISNQKGGVGKTTTTITLGHGLALLGHRTLIVDLDAQGNCAAALRVDFERTTYDVLIDRRPVVDCIIEVRPDLWLLPSDATMAEVKDRIVAEAAVSAVASMAGGRRSQVSDPTRILAQAMANVDGYEYILLDCAPGVDIMSANALMYAQEVILPVSVDYLATVGAGQHVQSIVDAQSQGSEVFISVVLPTFYEAHTLKAREILEQLQTHFGRIVADPIPKTVRVAEAPGYAQTLWEYAPKSTAAQAYERLLERIING